MRDKAQSSYVLLNSIIKGKRLKNFQQKQNDRLQKPKTGKINCLFSQKKTQIDKYCDECIRKTLTSKQGNDV